MSLRLYTPSHVAPVKQGVISSVGGLKIGNAPQDRDALVYVGDNTLRWMSAGGSTGPTGGVGPAGATGPEGSGWKANSVVVNVMEDSVLPNGLHDGARKVVMCSAQNDVVLSGAFRRSATVRSQITMHPGSAVDLVWMEALTSWAIGSNSNITV